MTTLDSEVSRLILFCFVLIYVIGGTIFTSWTIYLLNGLSKLAVIQKRYSLITTIVVILSLILIIIVYLLYTALIIFENRINSELQYRVFNILLSILNIICFDGILYLVLLRFWLMYFDVQYTISILEGEWIAFLDPKNPTDNWYFNKKDTYGNIKWLSYYVCIIVSLSSLVSICILMLILFHIIEYYCYIINIILHLIPILINVYIYRKTPTFYDHYYMRDEMKAINIVFIIYLICQIIYYIIKLIEIYSNEYNINKQNIWLIEIFYIIIKITLIGSLCFISTGWIVSIITSEYGSYDQAKHCPIQEQSQHPAKFKFIFISQQPSNPNNITINTDDDIRMPVLMHRQKKHLEDIEISKKLKLPQILSKNESFTLFMQHLSRETFMACLLSFVEYYQYKQLLKDNFTNINTGTFGNAKLAPSIPQSIIVHTPYPATFNTSNNTNNTNNSNNSSKHNEINDDDIDNELKEYKCRAYMLYNKYIKDGAELQLKLPPDYKKKLDSQMDELDKLVNSDIDSDQLFHIFDDVIFSQYQIMWKSYQRFVKTGDYELVESFMKQNIN